MEPLLSNSTYPIISSTVGLNIPFSHEYMLQIIHMTSQQQLQHAQFSMKIY
jgi:hypothetical protein